MTNLFSEISNKNKRKILHILEANIMSFPKNCQVLSSVKIENTIGFIEKGHIQITKLDYNGNIIIVEDLPQGSVFETSIFSKNDNEYEISTKEETSIIILDYNLIKKQKNNFPYYTKFIQNLLEISIEKIEKKNEQIKILSNKTIRNKLLEYFKILSKKTGTRTVYLPLSYSDLAGYLAIDRCAMSREMKYLQEEGFIKKEGKKIVLLYEE